MLLTVLSYVPAVIVSCLIGLLTLLKNTRAKTNIYFSVFTFSLGLWLAMLFLGDISTNPNFSLWAVRFATFFGTLMIAGVIFFSTVFPEPLHKPSRLFVRINLLLPASLMALSLTPFLVPSVVIRDNSAQLTNLGLLYTLQSVYAIGGFLFAIIVILRKYRRVDSRAKAQIRLVVYGMLIAVSVNTLTGFVLILLNISNNFSNLIGSVSFLILVAATSYAIVRHRLFDIRMAIARTVGFLVTISVVGGVYSLLVFLIIEPLIEDSHVGLLLLIPPTLFIALTFQLIQNFIARVTARIFYQELFDLRTTIDKLSDTLVANTDINEIMHSSLGVISEAIKPSHAYFVVFDDSGRVYRKITLDTNAPNSISELIGDTKNIKDNPVVRDEMPEADIPRSFVSDDIFLALRLGLKDKPVGVLLLGPKQNGRTYLPQDIDLLRIAAKNLAVALDNAKKYQEISHFADRLHKEVLHATSKLRAANEELKTLDALKDDFISMASHQLRTPASSVHEALQMLNHSDIPLTKQDRLRLLELAEASSEHLVTVVADMLSIARIQAGHFIVNKSKASMQDMVGRVLKQTTIVAEQKHTKIIFNKPESPIELELDASKINEAMSNYIENAIKYSPEKTTVIITLSVEDKRCVFEVSDMGMGVPEDGRKGLFDKFYRAQNARVEQPEGNGIGLFVVKSIVQGHGGDVYYRPLKSGGSLFGFWLPL